MNTKKIAGILAVSVIALIVLAVIFTSLQSETQNPEPEEPTEPEHPTEPEEPTESEKRIDISYYTSGNNTIMYGSVSFEDPGFIWLSAHVTIKNNGYDAFNTNTLYWFLLSEDYSRRF